MHLAAAGDGSAGKKEAQEGRGKNMAAAEYFIYRYFKICYDK
jgi:hypothetical protein